MSARILIATVTTIAAIVSPAMAQDSAPDKPAMSASMPMDCKTMVQGGKGSMPRHDSQMQTVGTRGKDMPCSGEEASKSSKPAKAKPAHDHAKFHKNQ